MATLIEMDLTNLENDSIEVINVRIENCKIMIRLSARQKKLDKINPYIDILVILLTEKVKREIKNK